MEFELEGGVAGNPAGVLVIRVPGGGWIRAYPALAAGARFHVVFGFPPPATDFTEIVWDESVIQEIGAWTITYTNSTAAAIGVDGGIAETEDLDGKQAETDFDFVGDPPEHDVLIEFGIAPIPTISEWGMVVMVLLVMVVGTVAVTRYRAMQARA